MSIAYWGFLGVLIFIVGRICWSAFYNAYLSALKDIPGPFLAKFTEVFLAVPDFSGYRTRFIHGLHQKYGRIVRIGPNEISISDPELIKDVYGFSTAFTKTDFYKMIGTPGVFHMKDHVQHRERRRLLTQVFTASSLTEAEPSMVWQIQKLSQRLDEFEGQTVNMLHWFRMLSLDIVGELFLGKSFGAMDGDDSLGYIHDLDNLFPESMVQAKFGPVTDLLRVYGPASVRHFLHTTSRFHKYGSDALADYLQRFGRHTRRKDLISKMIESANESKGIDDHDIGWEVSHLVFAGTDTTSTTLTYLFWEIARRPELQQKLIDELRTSATIEGDGTYSFKDLDGLIFLDAIVKESLRVHPAAPASLPRMPPASGARIGDLFIPAGTTVSAQCYTTQRDPSIFPEPEMFKPERWFSLKVDSPELKELYSPFGRGTRVCLGQHMAMMELKLIVAMILHRFSIKCADDLTEDDMKMMDHFLVYPKAKKCDLVFKRRSTS